MIAKEIMDVFLGESNDERYVVDVLYVNYRGETAMRRIIPGHLFFGHTEYHPDDQWLLDVFDYDKKVSRTFAMKDIKEWKAAEQ